MQLVETFGLTAWTPSPKKEDLSTNPEPTIRETRMPESPVKPSATRHRHTRNSSEEGAGSKTPGRTRRRRSWARAARAACVPCAGCACASYESGAGCLPLSSPAEVCPHSASLAEPARQTPQAVHVSGVHAALPKPSIRLHCLESAVAAAHAPRYGASGCPGHRLPERRRPRPHASTPRPQPVRYHSLAFWIARSLSCLRTPHAATVDRNASPR